MENGTLERIRTFADFKKMSVNAFAKEIKMNQATVNNYFICSRKLSYEFVDSILDTFKDLSAEWLLRGVEPMLISDNYSPASERELREVIRRQQREIDGLYERISELKGETDVQHRLDAATA